MSRPRLKPVDTEEVLDEQELPDFDRRSEALLDKPTSAGRNYARHRDTSADDRPRR